MYHVKLQLATDEDQHVTFAVQDDMSIADFIAHIEATCPKFRFYKPLDFTCAIAVANKDRIHEKLEIFSGYGEEMPIILCGQVVFTQPEPDRRIEEFSSQYVTGGQESIIKLIAGEEVFLARDPAFIRDLSDQIQSAVGGRIYLTETDIEPTHLFSRSPDLQAAAAPVSRLKP